MVVVLSFACSVTLAANRCVDAKGKVTYQDAACDGAAAGRQVDTSEAFSARPAQTRPNLPPSLAPTGQSSSGDDGYTNAHGTWRGPAQFQFSAAGVRDGDAQRISPMVIEIKSDGEIVGVIPGAGCHLSGLATQFVAEYIASIDVSIKGCHDDRFNARYSGQLAAVRSAKEARMTLNSLRIAPFVSRVQIGTIEAVLKR